MNRNLIRSAALAAAVVLGACSEKQLTVTNQNQGDTKRVLGTAADAENLLGTYYKRWHSGVYGSTTDVEGMANVMALMNYSSLANNCQNSHYPFVGSTNFNSPGNTCQGEQFRLYSIESEVDRVASNILSQMADSGLTIGNTTPATDAQNIRAKGFAEFLRGLSLGYIALMHDSAGIISPNMSKEAADCLPDPLTKVCVGALRGYKEVMDSALAAMQRAIDYASTPASALTGTNGFAAGLPATWIPSPTTFTGPEFVRLVRTYRARLRANVARTPAERAAVDWAAVVADAQNGITADHLNTTSTTLGPSNSWRQQYDAFSTWHQMPAFVIGMADTSGSYAAWIAQPLGERGAGKTPFFMVTPDLRFPQGGTRAAQQADFAVSSCAAASQTCKRYFVNRASGGDNFDGIGWGWSNYDFVRFHSWVLKGDGTARNGNTVFFTKSELDLLQAEGLYRQGNFAGAAALVNLTRVKNGLPAITAFDATSPVPGGTRACVPKVPVAPFNVVACGNLWEALKYEKRIETAYTSYAPWYLDMRGWGDLPADTPLFWAVPFQELQARGRPTSSLYGAGVGAGNAPGSTAAKGTYGW
jgi:hypothetical protein